VSRRVIAAGVLTGLALLAAGEPASAQSLWVKGGINLSTVRFSPPEEVGVDVSGEVGPTVGAALTFKDAARLSYELGGQLSIRRVAFGPDVTDTITYIEVPALARYAFVRGEGLTIRAVGGGSMGFRIAASESVGGDSSSVTDSYKPFDFAVVIGAQAEWKTRWVFEGRYLFGLSDVYDVTVGGFETSQRGFQILVGYRLR
jgi:hypothetical protein